MEKKTEYDFRVVREYDAVLDIASGQKSSAIYCLYECHYDQDGKVVSMSLINDMTCYSRADATDFLLRMSAAVLKPVLGKTGETEEDGLINPGQAVLSFINKG